jgi:hypothetical protein
MPKADSTAGTPMARITTRSVCTMATPRTSQSFCSAASAITWLNPPGTPAKTAVIVFQPCTLVR